MDIKRMKEFMVIAQHGSLHEAASALRVSSATLSARLKGFEAQLGVSLFQRGKQGVTLTSGGERFLTEARTILQSYEALVGDIQTAQEDRFTRLTIAAICGGLPLHMGPYLDRFNEKHPEVRMCLTDDTECSIQEGLLSESIDLYCAPLLEGWACNGLEKSVLSTAGQYVIVPRGHRLASQISVTMDDLADERFILYPKTEECCVRDYQMAALAASGIRYTLYDAPCSLAMYQLLVPIGKGIILLPIRMDGRLPPNAVSLIIKRPVVTVESCIVSRQHTLSPEAQMVLRNMMALNQKGEPQT